MNTALLAGLGTLPRITSNLITRSRMLRPCFHSCLIGEKPHWLSSRGESQQAAMSPPPQLHLGAFTVILLRNITDLQGSSREQVLPEPFPKLEKGMQRRDAAPGEEMRGFGAEALFFSKLFLFFLQSYSGTPDSPSHHSDHHISSPPEVTVQVRRGQPLLGHTQRD